MLPLGVVCPEREKFHFGGAEIGKSVLELKYSDHCFFFNHGSQKL